MLLESVVKQNWVLPQAYLLDVFLLGRVKIETNKIFYGGLDSNLISYRENENVDQTRSNCDVRLSHGRFGALGHPTPF